ncbi:hypothetical protein [Algibacter sp. 2305UL17-15]|uniref:hypothetical protein n=1 Tax=Algibacter sp. 2305UL17-15 TaxID=3231268 RepID=UPI00345A248D
MKTFIFDLMPKIKRYSKELDDLTLLKNKNWVAVNELDDQKTVYIFDKKNRLIVSNSGEVTLGEWSYLNNNSVLISLRDSSFLLNHGFLDDVFLILNQDGTDKYALFINENEFTNALISIDGIQNYLTNKYLKNNFTRANYRTDFPMGRIFLKINPLTLNEEGRYNDVQIRDLNKKGKLLSYDKLVSVKDKKTYFVKDILFDN